MCKISEECGGGSGDGGGSADNNNRSQCWLSPCYVPSSVLRSGYTSSHCIFTATKEVRLLVLFSSHLQMKKLKPRETKSLAQSQSVRGKAVTGTLGHLPTLHYVSPSYLAPAHTHTPSGSHTEELGVALIPSLPNLPCLGHLIHLSAHQHLISPLQRDFTAFVFCNF